MQEVTIIASVLGNDIRLTAVATGEVLVEKATRSLRVGERWIRIHAIGETDGEKTLGPVVQTIFNELEGTTDVKVSREESRVVLNYIGQLLRVASELKSKFGAETEKRRRGGLEALILGTLRAGGMLHNRGRIHPTVKGLPGNVIATSHLRTLTMPELAALANRCLASGDLGKISLARQTTCEKIVDAFAAVKAKKAVRS